TVTTTTVTTAQGVTVTINANTGVFTYTPNAGYVGTDSFVYTICDNGSPQSCDQATVYLTIDGVAGLNVVKSAYNANGNSCIVANDVLVYTFTVTNPGDLLIDSITITDTLLGGDITADVTLSGDTNGDGFLHPSETWVYTAPDYIVTQANVDNGIITNSVTVVGLEPDGVTSISANDTYVIDENNTDVTFCDPTSGLNIVKSATIANGDACLALDSEVTYTFTVTNTGSVSVNTVTINDTLLGGDITADVTLSGDTNTNGVLEPTETWSFTAPNYTVTQADIDAGVITNTVTVTGNEILNNTEVSANDTYVIDENNTDVTFCDPTSGLNIVKSAAIANGDACLALDSEVTYTFTVTNTGTVSINTVTINDTLLGGDITADVTLSGDTNTNGVLEPTETWSFTAPNYIVTQADIDAGVITNTVTVTGNEILNNTEVSANDTYVIDENNTDVTFCDPTSGLNIVKSAAIANGDACLALDSEVTYTFTVTNTGTVSINTVTINDTLLGGDITADVTLSGDTNTNGVLEPTETWSFTAPNYIVTQADIDAGVITNTVTVTGNEILNNTEVSANDTYVIDENNTEVTFCDPTGSINIVKTGIFNNDNGNECTEIDETISYTFTVTNTGTVSLENVVITDSLLDNAVPSVSITLVSGDINDNDILEPTETWIYTATYLVTQLDIDATEVINIATVNAVIIVNGETVTDSDEITTELIEDTTPPDASTCEVLDETIECNGDNNIELATNWDAANILALENCTTDACDDNVEVTSNFDYSNLITTCGNSGTIEVTYTLTDATGNFSTYTSTLTIEDTTGPDLSACTVIDETIECGGTDNQTIADAWNADNITALQSCGTDTCDVDPTNTVTSDYNFNNLVSTCGAGGSITVTYTVADDCGNTSQLTATLTLEDTTGPDLSACTVIDETIECGGTDNQTIADAWNAENMTALQSCGTDTCDVDPTNTVTSDYDFANLVSTCGASGTITVTYTVADDCGNTSQLTATLTLEDTTGPDLTACTVIDETIECGGTDNQTIADAWNAENMTALQSCGTDTCDV
ncbi:beta strand repeat-containing protein, partial [Olleya marilimosa]